MCANREVERKNSVYRTIKENIKGEVIPEE
jgi:hypothetical protein